MASPSNRKLPDIGTFDLRGEKEVNFNLDISSLVSVCMVESLCRQSRRPFVSFQSCWERGGGTAGHTRREDSAGGRQSGTDWGGEITISRHYHWPRRSPFRPIGVVWRIIRNCPETATSLGTEGGRREGGSQYEVNRYRYTASLEYRLRESSSLSQTSAPGATMFLGLQMM